jgi:hypothetical protein
MLTIEQCRKYLPKDSTVTDEKLKEMIDYIHALSVESIKSNYKNNEKKTI